MYEFLPIGYMLRGRYRILRVIGGGGMGAVYKSEDTRNGGMHVAVKEMRTDIESHAARPPAGSPSTPIARTSITLNPASVSSRTAPRRVKWWSVSGAPP